MSRERAKGTAFETAVVNFLRRTWPYAERRAGSGSTDCGDVSGVPMLVAEVKNRATLALAEWLDEALLEARNADKRYPGSHFGVVVHKRRMQPPEHAYVTLRLDDFVHIYASALTTMSRRLGGER